MISEQARQLWEADSASRELGIELVESGEGKAVATLRVTEQMINGMELCHGGIVFALADTALAFAANSDGSGAPTTHASIAYAKSAVVGDELVARASVDDEIGKNLIVGVEVVNQRDEVVATVRGTSRRIW